MGIIQQLQLEVIENKKLDYILRKSYFIAKRLGKKDFEEWIYNELNGYGNDNIPDYRIIKCELKGSNKPQGNWNSIIIPDRELESKINVFKVKQSIIEIEKMIDSKNKTFVNLPDSLNIELSKMIGDSAKFRIFINRIQLEGILNTVKNKILEWTFMLAEEGIKGEGDTFTNDEKEKAKNIYITNVINVKDGDLLLQQNSNNSTQIKNNDINLDDIFDKLIEVTEQIQEKCKEEIIKNISEMKRNRGNENFKDSYFKFIENAANHMSLFAPFMQILTGML